MNLIEKIVLKFNTHDLINILNSEFDINTISNYSSSLFSKDIIEKYGLKLLSKLNSLPDNLKGNCFLLKKCFECQKYDFILLFDKELITKNIKINNYLNEFLDYIDEIPFILRKDIDFLKFILFNNKSKLLNQFSNELITVDLFFEHNINLNSIILLLDNFQLPKSVGESTKVFKLILNNKLYKYLKLFDLNILINDDIINDSNYEKILLSVNKLPLDLKNSKKVLKYCLNNPKLYHFLSNFNLMDLNYEIDDNFLDKTNIIGIYNYYDCFPKNIRGSKQLFRSCINSELYDYIDELYYESLDDDLLSDNIIINVYSKLNNFPKIFYYSKKFLLFCLKYHIYSRLQNFQNYLWTEDMLDENNIKDVFNAIEIIPNKLLRSTKLLGLCISNNLNTYLKCFYEEAWDDNLINDDFISTYGKCLDNIFNGKLPNKLKSNLLLLDFCFKHGLIQKYLYQFDNHIFSNEIINKYQDELINIKLNNLDFANDNPFIIKFFIDYSLKHNNFDLLNFIFYRTKFNNDEKIKICKILTELILYNNMVLYSVSLDFLNLDLDLNINELVQITRFENIQNKILDLNPNHLKMFKEMMKVLRFRSNNYDIMPIVSNIIDNIFYIRNFDYSYNDLRLEHINNLILLLQNTNKISIDGLSDLTNQSIDNRILNYLNSIRNNIDNVSNDSLIEAILVKRYSLSYSQGSFIFKRYHDSIKYLDDNFKMRDILININKIFNSDNSVLRKMFFENGPNLKIDYMSALFLESSIRKEFANLYDKTLYKLNDNDLFNTSEILKSKLKSFGVPMYILSNDFNMQVHSLHAYVDSNIPYPPNYLTDWLTPNSTSDGLNHGLCTSFIGNDKIVYATTIFPIFGFDSIKGHEFLLSGPRDIFSENISLSISLEQESQFLPPQAMIDNTCIINEIVRERVSYYNNKCFKVMPSYIVYFIDDINNLENFTLPPEINSSKTEYFSEVLKCARNFNIPIVIVDRLYYAKYEKSKCDELLEKFKLTNDLNLIEKLLIKFNNKYLEGNAMDDDIEANEIFNDDLYKDYINKIIDIILLKNDSEFINKGFKVLLNILEKYKMQHYEFDEYLSSLEDEFSNVNLSKKVG